MDCEQMPIAGFLTMPLSSNGNRTSTAECYR